MSSVDELAEFEGVLESVEMLADLLANGHLPEHGWAEQAPLMLATIIDWRSTEVRLLRWVVLRQADPRLLSGRRNSRSPTLARWEDPDILLKVRPRRR